MNWVCVSRTVIKNIFERTYLDDAKELRWCLYWVVCGKWYKTVMYPSKTWHTYLYYDNYHCFPQSPIFQAHRIVIDRSDKKQFEVKTIGPSMHVFLEDEAVRSQSPSLQDETSNTSGPNDLYSKIWN